tara:strand:+ start:3743 stop:6283 length:2541 start_codon:yes stop_codon:yes gene_type:complete
MPRIFLAALFFASGVAGLIYEILWFRHFGILFGNVVHATALVLVAFFSGLALGNHWIGRYADRVTSPLRLYGILELGVVVTALPIPFFLDVLESLPISRVTPDGFFLISTLAVLAVLPAAMFMGGTLPVLGCEVVSRLKHGVAESGGRLYAINTFGAACGALATGCFLPLYIGVWNTYLVAVGINCFIAIVVLLYTKQVHTTTAEIHVAQNDQTLSESLIQNNGGSVSLILSLSLLSGLFTLCLQVMWTRMFALVFHNSVFSFAIIVVTFLVGLAVGAFIISRLMSEVKWTHTHPWQLLIWVLVITAVLISLSPPLFMMLTGLEREPHADVTVWPLLWAASLTTLITVPPIITAGMILPLLWHVYRPQVLIKGCSSNVGSRLGSVMAANFIGAILGALTAGFVVIPLVGLWQGVFLIALMYVICALVVMLMCERRDQGPRGISTTRLATSQKFTVWIVVVIIAGGNFFVPHSLGGLQRLKDGETLIFHQEGSSAAVAVLKRKDGHLKLKVNNTYGLGGTSGEIQERRMGHLPLLLHKKPGRIAFIGVATGITMSALNLTPRGQQVERVLAVELLPQVVEAASVFRDYTGDVLSDPRVEVRIGDGRQILHVSDEHFDVITLDLVTPWHANAGSLYSVEFYAEISNQLAEGGLFWQWLPLYQLGPREFKIIAKTFQSVFPHVQLWRGSINPRYPVLGLVGSNHEIDLARDLLAGTTSDGEVYPTDPYLVDLPSLFLLYAGNEEALRPLLHGIPLNSDDRPLVEYLAPMSHLSSHQLLGETLIYFFDDMLHGPGWVSESHRVFSTAGNLILAAKWAKRQKDYDKRRELLDRVRLLVPESQYIQRFVIGL